ncbi:MAG TPA: TetR/AcrR family transcriptional regulator [Solirubrobacteraceae bacterium]|nr:TetR/AcrR family transcriptional regulator [Solirubrobacteraceae bacterium]
MPRERREQEILDVAGAIFARAGYHSASMDEIADSAGVSKPMVYAYFGSKEGLYLAYIERAGGELLERLVAARSPDPTPGARLRARITEFLAFVEEHGDGWRVLFRETGSTQPIAEHVAEIRERIAAAIGAMIEAGAGSWPGYGPPRSDAIAHALVGAGESLANWWLDHPDVGRDRVADWYLGVVQAVLAGPRRASG